METRARVVVHDSIVGERMSSERTGRRNQPGTRARKREEKRDRERENGDRENGDKNASEREHVQEIS